MRMYDVTTLQVGSVINKHRSAVFLIFVIFSFGEDLHERMVNNALGLMMGITTVVDITKNNSQKIIGSKTKNSNPF